MYKHFTIAACAASCLSPGFSFAADQLAAVVVTATRQPTRISEVIADVSVIDREAIEQAGPSTTLGDLLARTPGIELSRAGGRGATESVFIRGANAGHTLILLDGLRISSATLGQSSLEAIPLAQVERIEILRGPASALYGSDAIGGVIRITTRRAADAPRLEASAGVGSRGSRELTLAHANRVGKFDYAVRVADSRAEGVNAITNPGSPAYNPDRDGFARRSLSLAATWRPREGIEIGAHGIESDGVSHFDSSWPSANLDWQTRTRVVAHGVFARARLAEAWQSELRLGRGEDHSITTPSSTAGQDRDAFRTRQDQVVWQNDLTLPLGRGLVAVESLRESIDSTNVYTSLQRRTDSLVLGWNGSAGAHFWQIGARRDDNSQFGARNTHTLGYGYRLSDAWRLSASAGTSFKAPTFNDLYFPNTPFVGAGNPLLLPESGRSRELALHYEMGSTEASLTAFRNEIENLIQWQETAPGSFFYTPRNVATARITGWTAAARSSLGAWTLDAGLTVQDPKNLANGEALVRRARQFGSLAASRDFGDWSLGAELQASGPRYDAPDFTTGLNTKKMGGYGLVNLRGELRLNHGWSLFARVDNLFDKRYDVVRAATSEFAALGTTLFLGARFAMK